MEKYFFQEEISGQKSWSEIFRRADSFASLARHILDRHDLLGGEKLQSLTPGTNAVFRAGNYVLKLFAPEESGFGDPFACQNELAALKFAAAAGVRTPAVLAAGEISDKYRFFYVIMEFMQGEEAGKALPSLNAEQKRRFAEEIKHISDALHRPATGFPKFCRSLRADLSWQGLCPALREDMRTISSSAPPQEEVFVHGDLTGENVLLMPDGKVALLDLGDARRAPSCYELPPLVFELFRGDKAMIDWYLKGGNAGVFLSELLLGLSLHEFGGNIVKDLLARRGRTRDSICGAGELLSYFYQILC